MQAGTEIGWVLRQCIRFDNSTGSIEDRAEVGGDSEFRSGEPDTTLRQTSTPIEKSAQISAAACLLVPPAVTTDKPSCQRRRQCEVKRSALLVNPQATIRT
jgi:hypothetical protein